MLSFLYNGIAEALKVVQERINNCAIKTGRNPKEIKLVAVSKTIELPRIIEAVKAGVTILGENRVQEAREKITNYKLQITNYKVEWHLIGNLQKNKAKIAIQLFDLIHSLDSIGLAEELNKRCEQIGKQQRVLVQIKLSEEPTKHGVLEKDLMELLEKVNSLKNLKLEGLMTMPPFFEDPEETRPYFKRLREIRDEMKKKGFHLPELSMGMSHDFEIAIQEGATMVRIGTAIFGERVARG
jgi:hypothetical protein